MLVVQRKRWKRSFIVVDGWVGELNEQAHFVFTFMCALYNRWKWLVESTENGDEHVARMYAVYGLIER